MENLTYLQIYNTDIYGSWGIGQQTIDSNESFENVLKVAMKEKAHVIVKPSRGKYWYIKGFNKTKSFNEIESHIEMNNRNNYKKNSTLWLINFNNKKQDNIDNIPIAQPILPTLAVHSSYNN